MRELRLECAGQFSGASSEFRGVIALRLKALRLGGGRGVECSPASTPPSRASLAPGRATCRRLHKHYVQAVDLRPGAWPTPRDAEKAHERPLPPLAPKRKLPPWTKSI